MFAPMTRITPGMSNVFAPSLKEQGFQLGIEFLGPKTLRDGHRYPFINTLREMMQLAADIGTGNVGLLLDAWHHYTSGGALEVRPK